MCYSGEWGLVKRNDEEKGTGKSSQHLRVCSARRRYRAGTRSSAGLLRKTLALRLWTVHSSGPGCVGLTSVVSWGAVVTSLDASMMDDGEHLLEGMLARRAFADEDERQVCRERK